MPKCSMLVWAGRDRDPSYLLAFLLACTRQTLTDFEIVVQIDGHRQDIMDMLIECGSYLALGKIRCFPTTKLDGRWGYGCKAEGIALCEGDYICFCNDDNYVVPRFFEMMAAELDKGHDLVLCDMVHHYSDYQVLHTRPAYGFVDLCSWMARAKLVKETPWPGDYREADGHFVERMAAVPGVRIGKVDRPILVHN